MHSINQGSSLLLDDRILLLSLPSPLFVRPAHHRIVLNQMSTPPQPKSTPAQEGVCERARG